MVTKLEFSYGVMSAPPQDDTLLYHYCGMGAFLSIIRSGKIRLGNLLMMNDPSEMALRNVNIGEILKAHYEKSEFDFKFTHNGVSGAMDDYLSPIVGEAYISANKQFSRLVHALCLSNDGNDLSQWRLYGDNGKGVCIGFERAALNSFVESHKEFSLEEVKYFSSQDDLVNEIAQNIITKLKELYEQGDNEALCKYRFNIINDLADQWAKYKNSAYQNEKETRLIHSIRTKSVLPNIDAFMLAKEKCLNNIVMELERNAIKTYIEVPINSIGIKSVTLGPCNTQNGKANLNILFAQNKVNIDAQRIYKSNIPYVG